MQLPYLPEEGAEGPRGDRRGGLVPEVMKVKIPLPRPDQGDT